MEAWLIAESCSNERACLPYMLPLKAVGKSMIVGCVVSNVQCLYLLLGVDTFTVCHTSHRGDEGDAFSQKRAHPEGVGGV